MNNKRPKPKPSLAYSRKSKISFMAIVIIVALCISITIFLLISFIPIFLVDKNDPFSNRLVNNIVATKDTRSLSKKLFDWLPKRNSDSTHIKHTLDEPPPDWDEEFWTPIDYEPFTDIITFCKLNFKEYSMNPHTYPMFRDLESLSRCTGSNRKREKLSITIQEIHSKNQRIIEPTAFIFHESRVGSTLVANELASDPWSMVFSESPPTANALLHCSNNDNNSLKCNKQKSIQIFRDIVTLMSRSPFHKRLFFKFQSITSTRMEIALEVGGVYSV